MKFLVSVSASLALAHLAAARPQNDLFPGVTVDERLAFKPGDTTAATKEPTTYPPADQTKFIDGAFLTDALVVDAMKIVTATVPANLLAIPPSTFIKDSTVTYKGDAAANCYWPAAQCLRQTDGVGYVADVSTCNGPNQWGITYDDGPTKNLVNGKSQFDSTAISDLVLSVNGRATYFVTGSASTQNPDVLAALDKAGHQIASHTWTHHPLTSLTNEQVVAEIKYTEAIIYKTIGKVPAFMRPPYGDVDDRVRSIVNALGYRVALWTQDSTDASLDPTPANKVKSLDIIKTWFGLKTPFISLEHDISTFTSEIAVDALQAFKTSGSTLKLVTVADCTGFNAYSFGGANSTRTNSTTTAVRTATTVVPTTTAAPTPTGASAANNNKPSAATGRASAGVGLMMLIVGALVVLV